MVSILWDAGCHSLLGLMYIAQGTSKVSIEKSAAISTGFPLYLVCSFSLTIFNVHSLLCIIGILTVIYCGDFLFWSFLFGVLCFHCVQMDVSILSLWNVPWACWRPGLCHWIAIVPHDSCLLVIFSYYPIFSIFHVASLFGLGSLFYL